MTSRPDKPEPTKWKRAKKVFKGHPMAIAGLIGVTLFILTAIFAPLIAPQNPYDLAKLDILDGLLPPGSRLYDGTYSVMGTDALGRDILSGVMYGLRISLFVAFTAVLVGSSIGVLLGLLAELRGGERGGDAYWVHSFVHWSIHSFHWSIHSVHWSIHSSIHSVRWSI